MYRRACDRQNGVKCSRPTPLGHWLSTLLWPPPPAPPDAERVLADSLASLRSSRAALEARAADKRRRIEDDNRALVALAAGDMNRLSSTTAHAFRRAYRRRQFLVLSHAQFQRQLENLDQQIERLGDMPALELSTLSLQASLATQAARAADARATVERMNTDMKTLADTSALYADVDRSMARLDDGELARTFAAELEPDELDRLRRLVLDTPAVPRAEPGEATLGLIAV